MTSLGDAVSALEHNQDHNRAGPCVRVLVWHTAPFANII